MVRTAEGGSLRFGRLDLDVLWPPRDDPLLPGEDAERPLARPARARFGGYDALLTGDAEPEATHLDPGPIDVLKVAHHGSDDAGLEALLDRSAPRVALIERRGRQHATATRPRRRSQRSPSTGVCVLRTDLDGDVDASRSARPACGAWTRGRAAASRPPGLRGGARLSDRGVIRRLGRDGRPR